MWILKNNSTSLVVVLVLVDYAFFYCVAEFVCKSCNAMTIARGYSF